MKYLIVYMSRHGTTTKVVSRLQESLGSKETSAVNLQKGTIPDLNGFETIIVGGSIHMGQIQKTVTNFCESYKSNLLKHRLGLFICCMNHEQAVAEFENAFSVDLRNHATACGIFGGELLIDKMNLIEKMITRKVTGVKENVSEIDEEAIRSFVSSIQQNPEHTVRGSSK